MVDVGDEELEALMAELEAQNEEIAAAVPKVELEKEIKVVKEVKILKEKVIEESVVTPDAPPWDSVDATKEGIAPLPEKTVPVKTTERRVVVNDEGEVIQPALNAIKAAQSPVQNTLQHYVDVDEFRKDTSVSDVNLDKCMMEQSGLRAYYGAQAARAEAQASRVKAKFEVVEATLYDHHRKQLAADPSVKVTEKMVENSVKLDPRWLKAKNLVIEAESIAGINKALSVSLADRKDMIVQLGADRRDEFKGAARVLAEQQDRDDLRNRAKAAMGRAAA
jgi:hypothetical protein